MNLEQIFQWLQVDWWVWIVVWYVFAYLIIVVFCRDILVIKPSIGSQSYNEKIVDVAMQRFIFWVFSPIILPFIVIICIISYTFRVREDG